MKFNKPAGKKNNGRIEDGTYSARVVQVIDLGVQKDEYNGEEKIKPEVLVTFEFPTELLVINGEERPRWLSKNYTVSLHEKAALTQLLNAVDPDGKLTKKGANPQGILGQACMITVGSTASGNAKVVGVSRLLKGLQVPELDNPTAFFDLDSDSKDNKAVFESLPDWIKTKIQSAMNYDNSAFNGNSSVTNDPY